MNVGAYADLVGKVAVVTGGARGMGERFARGLTAAGVKVVVGDLDREGVDDVARSVAAGGADIVPVQMDVRVRADHDAAALAAVERFGRLDIWVNNAGVFPSADLVDVDAPQLDTTFAVNVDGVLFGCQAAASAMSAGGVIVNMASVAAFRVRPGRVAYSISKAAVDHLTRFGAVEFGGRGIRVNAIAPGFIDTDMTRWLREQPGAWETAMASVPLGRIGTPDDVLAGLLFLVSEASSYVTGTTLVIDGGTRSRSS